MAGKKRPLTFGQALWKAREKQEIERWQLAEEVGVHRTYIHLIEREQKPAPPERLLRKMASIVGMDEITAMALGGRVPSELAEAFKKHPHEIMLFIRNLDSYASAN